MINIFIGILQWYYLRSSLNRRHFQATLEKAHTYESLLGTMFKNRGLRFESEHNHVHQVCIQQSPLLAGHIIHFKLRTQFIQGNQQLSCLDILKHEE